MLKSAVEIAERAQLVVALLEKFVVISTGYKKGKDGEPSKDTTHPTTAGAEAFAKLFVADVKARGLSVAKMFK